MKEEINFEQIRDAVLKIADELNNNRQYYNDLDSPIGDSDHGDSICSAFQKVKETVNDLDSSEEDIGALMKTVGRAIVFSSGAAMGPLYGTAFMEAGKVSSGKSKLFFKDLTEFWEAFATGIETRGGVKLGEKTMYDTIRPAVDALKDGYATGKSIDDSCKAAVEAAEKGMNSTKEMMALRGRSSRIGERSLGHIDPGAASMYTVLSTFFNSFLRLKNG